MGRSFGPPEPTPNAVVKHERSRSTLTVSTENGTMFHTLQEHGFSATGAATQADVQYQRAIKLDPSLKEAYGRLAMSYAKDHDTDDATKTIDQYLEWNPDEIFFHETKQKLGSAAEP
jgi:tetratricopeptide (TPR) repeat protein